MTPTRLQASQEWFVNDVGDFSLLQEELIHIFYEDDYNSPLLIFSDQIPQQIVWSITFQPEPH